MILAELIISATIAINPTTAAATVPDQWQPFASCVLHRESGGTLDRPKSGLRAKNPTSSAQGRWQFLDNAWRYGLAHMVATRLTEYGMTWRQAREYRARLRSKPIATWPAWAQDAGFSAVVSHSGGWRHWYKPGSPCNRKAPR